MPHSIFSLSRNLTLCAGWVAIGVLPASASTTEPLNKDDFIQRLTTPPNSGSGSADFPRPALPDRSFRKTAAPDSNGACTDAPDAPQPGTSSKQRNLVVVKLEEAPGAKPNVNLLLQFGNNSDQINASGKRELAVLVEALNSSALAEKPVAIIGHTNSLGTVEHNLRLSCARALAVVRELEARGVARQRLAPYGFASTQLRNAEQPEAPENRRVEVRRL